MRSLGTFGLIAVAVMLLTLQVPHAAESDVKRLEQLATTYKSEIRPLVVRYCQECHSAELIEAEIDLASFPTLDEVRKQPETWQKVREILDSGQMPPKDARQPTDAERTTLQKWVRGYLTVEAQARAGDPGRVGGLASSAGARGRPRRRDDPDWCHRISPRPGRLRDDAQPDRRGRRLRADHWRWRRPGRWFGVVRGFSHRSPPASGGFRSVPGWRAPGPTNGREPPCERRRHRLGRPAGPARCRCHHRRDRRSAGRRLAVPGGRRPRWFGADGPAGQRGDPLRSALARALRPAGHASARRRSTKSLTWPRKEFPLPSRCSRSPARAS